MRLIELRANRDSFRTVRFNPNGLTLIVGKKTNPDDRDREHSTNGVGKSLILYLINFCLGCRRNDNLKEHLPDWEFSLVFELNGKKHTVNRSTNAQDTVVFDGESTRLEDYTKLLGKDLFELPEEPVKYLTFRCLIGLFFRQGKPAYVSHAKTWDRETLYSQQLRTAYLLGLDERLVDTKRELKEENDRIKSIRQQFKKDSLLREYFQGDRDAGLELTDLEEEIAKLEGESRDFRVADNYEEVAAKAEETRRKWRSSRNQLNSLQSSLRQIAASLAEQPRVTLDEVREVYQAAQVQLPDAVTRRLEEVTKFHDELIASRSHRLTNEKHGIERRITELETEIQNLNNAKDEYFRFLGTHGALQEYETLLNTLADRRRLAARLQGFKQLKRQCDDRWQRNKLSMSEEGIRTSEYLNVVTDLTNEINERFRVIARRMWPNRTCGLLVENDDGDNKQRFDIDARIQGDASDGTGESKIFCFDMTVLLGGRNHKMKCLMHDNRLYPGIDHRQRLELFRIADQSSREHDCQYIATINEENLIGMQGIADAGEFASLLQSKVVLSLLDDSDSGKLLGVTVDLVYD